MKKMKGASLQHSIPKDETPTEEKGEPASLEEVESADEGQLHHNNLVHAASHLAKVHKLAGRPHKSIESLKDVKDYHQAKYGKKGK